MGKLKTNKPVVILLYGFPGAGKTHFAVELSKAMNAAHIQGDRIRTELFETPLFNKQEDEIVSSIMEYMAEEFLNAGLSVIFDTNASRLVQRRALRSIANRIKGRSLIVWLQIDQESALARLDGRDRRRNDDKYARPYTKEEFKLYVGAMQNPKDEDYVVISGKHTFTMQQNAIVKKFYDLGVISTDTAANNVAKPGLVNLVPTAGRVDMQRRNVTIR
ncbi:MAG: AAA family ATPase [Candidatus Saccharibacteria bacterium]